MPSPSHENDDRHLGSGWVSGILGMFLAIAGLAMVLCFRYPQILTVPQAREAYVDYVVPLRVLLHSVLIGGFVFGVISAALRRQKILGFVAIAIVLVASLLGGSDASQRFGGAGDYYLGLDFFLLNLVLLGGIFIPIERVFKRVDQPILRYEWQEDLLYFFVSTLFVQGLTFMSLAPSLAILAKTAGLNSVRSVISSQPLALQFVEIMFLTDLVQYWLHRSFHTVPWLWKFHAVHHSAQAMDWMAGSRMHVLEIIVLRACTTMPMYVLGFAAGPLYGYIFFVYLFSVFIHSNLRIPFGWLGTIIATPKFHHWHHGVEREAIDVNFAVHFPVLDRLFGTYHLPANRWPEGYGIHGNPVPKGYWRQFLYPFTRPRKEDAE